MFCNMSRIQHSRFAPSQWEALLLCSDVSYWLNASLESALVLYLRMCSHRAWQYLLKSPCLIDNMAAELMLPSLKRKMWENILLPPLQLLLSIAIEPMGSLKPSYHDILYGVFQFRYIYRHTHDPCYWQLTFNMRYENWPSEHVVH